MKKLILIIFTLLNFLNSVAQTPFPDPQASTYHLGAKLSEVPNGEEFSPTEASLATTLPPSVFNEVKPYFPNIIDQKDANSCVQVAEIGYVFTYEMNRKRGLTAGNLDLGNSENLYNPNYTYNFFNQGNPSTFTYYGSGFWIASRNGIPSYNDYIDESLSGDTWYKYWMTGFDKYFSGMHNVVYPTNKIFYFNSSNPGGVDNLKHWIADHSNGSTDGGIAVIGVIPNGWLFMTVPSGQYAGESYIWRLGQCPPWL